jgi:hypothetical protein
VRGPRQTPIGETAERLAPQSEILAQRLGVPFGPTKNGYLLVKKTRIATGDRANWPRAADWLHEQSEAYIAALTEVLEDRS